MEVRIKQGEEIVDATIEIVDGVMVVSPKVFEPKDLDVIVSGGDTRFVAIFKRMKDEYSFYYYALLALSGDKRPQINNWASFLNVCPATEEEKKLLFDKLKEEGLAWDAERKELVKLKWKPKEEEIFYFPIFSDELGGFVTDYEEYYETRFMSIERGWHFKTEQECQEFCNRLNEAISQVEP